ncbi:hypothetical protein CONPUDRAFT_70451 [Coniophora puteana RWD-64-598 SS2]|uniref:Uncharacterized protein n=1 Tax=Coniophora puteana (strain RWD-64-598) TaxID=741705 RepID=A0A5M3N2V6_CONPW|nr:uncharacterized protein CONPUDRAFT_70451 [Coniophora puteana RWD-64-598 SS2]EIW85713.1 hypothetical protein CONPUDRAFT_70451 [Coniophora puteana RWD-64-598 SS2]
MSDIPIVDWQDYIDVRQPHPTPLTRGYEYLSDIPPRYRPWFDIGPDLDASLDADDSRSEASNDSRNDRVADVLVDPESGSGGEEKPDPARMLTVNTAEALLWLYQNGYLNDRAGDGRRELQCPECNTWVQTCLAPSVDTFSAPEHLHSLAQHRGSRSCHFNLT